MAAAFPQSDFYLAASGLIPVLALADVVIRRRYVTMSDERLVMRLNRVAPWIEVVGAVTWGTFFTCAEFACLRSLEIQKASFGAPGLVWAALAFLAFQTVAYFVAAAVTEALPSRFLEGPPPEPLRIWRD